MMITLYRFFAIALILLSYCNVQAQCSLNMTVPADITICSPENINLIGSISGTYISSEWIGTNGFQDDDLITSNIPATSTTYTLSASASTGINLVDNGDFEDGDVGFTSSYLQGEVFCPVGPLNPYGILGCEGMYAITTDASSTHTNFQACTDHTTGAGNMMVVNGSSLAINIWCQNVTILANTDYAFSAWATSVHGSSPAILQFSINGNLIGSNFGLSGTTCQWENFNATWSSGSSTNATICITNQNTATSGNDFAIDDIVFEEVCQQEMSFNVTIAEVIGSLPTSNALNCDNPIIELDIQPVGPNYTFNWEANFGGFIDGPLDQSVANAVTQGLYQVTITDENGCTKKISTSVNGSTTPPETAVLGDFSLTCDMQEVTIFSTNTDSGNTYNWIGSSNNSTFPYGEYNEAGQFLLEITNQFNCSTFVPFSITNNIIAPQYNFPTPDTLSCIGDTVNISIEFNIPPNEMTWYDPMGNPIGNNTNTDVGDVGYYVIEFQYSNGCEFSDSILVTSQQSELDYLLGESPTLNCTDTTKTLSIDINSNYDQVEWIFGGVISATESVDINAAGLYTVEVTDANGCITRDSIRVFSDVDIPDFELTSEDIDCIDGLGTVLMSTDSMLTVSWILPDGSTEEENEITSSISGDYIAIVEHDNGCTTSDTITLFANQDFPVLSIEFDNLNCLDAVGEISAMSNIPNTDFSWTGPNGFTSFDQILEVTEPGEYIYIAVTDQGCSSSDTIEILGDFTEPELDLTAGMISCYNTTTQVFHSSNESYVVTNIDTDEFISQSNGVITIGEGGLTSITIIGSNGCSTTETIDVLVNYDIPEPITVEDFTLDCIHSDSTLFPTNDPDVIQYWIIGSDTVFLPTLEITAAAEYGIYLVDAESGCGVASFFEVFESFETADIAIEGNDINCVTDVSNITLDISQDVDLLDFPEELTQIDPENYTATEGGTYNFFVTYTNGCTATATIEIESDMVTPFFSTAEDIELPCNGDPVNLLASSTTTNISYQWSGPDNFTSIESSPETLELGSYQVEITNNDNGCTNITTIDVIENQTKILIDHLILQPACPGDFATPIYIIGEGGADPIVIIIEEMNGGDIIDPTQLLEGTYIIEATDANGCSGTETISIVDPPSFSTSLTNEITIAFGSETTMDLSTDLSETNISLIDWTPDEYLSCDNCLDPKISGLNENTWFYVDVVDLNGCTVTDSILVRVTVNFSFYDSNIFSPNEDGINDVFYIQSSNYASGSIIEELAIYDRWGNQVFKNEDFAPNDPREGWDGRFSSKKASQGVYAYYARILLPDGTPHELVGSITVLR